jgi:tetratricopeptide (TPR) repeat protein
MSFSESQGQSPLMHRADSLFEMQQYFEASIEYERVLYNQPPRETLVMSRYRKALCYRYLGRHRDALDEINRIGLFNIKEEWKNTLLYEKAFNLLLSGSQQEALMQFGMIREEQLPEAKKQHITPLKVLILNHNRQWQKAESTFLRWMEALPLSGRQQKAWSDSLTRLYDEDNLPNAYSEETARHWSRFIPGAGQVYAGHPWEGAMSFLLNGAAAALGVHQIYYGYYFTGYVAGFGILYKTYFGGMERAGHLANVERENEMVQFNRKCSGMIREIMREASTEAKYTETKTAAEK